MNPRDGLVHIALQKPRSQMPCSVSSHCGSCGKIQAFFRFRRHTDNLPKHLRQDVATYQHHQGKLYGAVYLSTLRGGQNDPCFIAFPVHVQGMAERAVKLLDEQGKLIMPPNAGTLPIVPLLEALVNAGWSDYQVGLAIRKIICNRETKKTRSDSKVIDLLRSMT